jgi:hypothetical protein
MKAIEWEKCVDFHYSYCFGVEWCTWANSDYYNVHYITDCRCANLIKKRGIWCGPLSDFKEERDNESKKNN